MKSITINKEVTVSALGFKKNLSAYPRQMEFNGHTYSFIDAGISCIVRSGERIAQILTLSDGETQFRLRSDSKGGEWTLLTMSV